jgi:hypothetical protein
MEEAKDSELTIPSSYTGIRANTSLMDNLAKEILLNQKTRDEVLEWLQYHGFKEGTIDRFMRGIDLRLNNGSKQARKEKVALRKRDAKGHFIKSFAKPANEETGELATDDNGNHISEEPIQQELSQEIKKIEEIANS